MFSVRVLGELALERDGIPVEPPVSRRARSLLGFLALDRRPHSRAELAARFWPDVLDESARTSLRSALAALRRSLEPDADRYLVATRERVGLTDDVWTDAAAFDEHVAGGRLLEAMELYRGDLLSGLGDDWVLAARDEWRERAAGVLARLAADAEAAGDWAVAIATTRRIVGLDPLGEDGQRALIRRLAAAGDRPAALAAYARYAERLRTELRIAPSPATRALVDELRMAEPEPEVAAAVAVPDEPPAPRQEHGPGPASGTVTLLFTDLVGSTELLGQLGEDEMERLRRGHFGLLRDVAETHAGQEVKSLGDGIMVAFSSSLDAVACAIAIQQAVDRDNRRTGTEHLRVRVGLNVGEPIRDEDDYFGTPVVIAKRLCDRAEGGQILASELIRLLVSGRGGVTFRPIGELALKGLAQPVATCEIAWEPAGMERIALPPELARDRTALVGREEELATLEDAWRRVQAGVPGVVMVAGEPGIGKTRLIAEFCRRAQADGATVLFGRSQEETLAPYQPWVEALRQYVAACPVDELRLQMGARRRILAKLVPEFAAAQDAAPTDPGDRFALFSAVASLLGEAARTHTAVVVLDDLHWADDATLLLLRHVAQASSDAPLLLLGTYRATELVADAPLSAALAELRRARMLESVSLAGLDADDVTALIRGLGTELSDELAHTVAQRTEGNPFFVEELVRHVDAGGQLGVPESIKDLLRRRLTRLGDPATRVLAAAAVLGREFDLAVLERIAPDGDEDVLEIVDAALAEHVLVEVPGDPGRLSFAHALIRETVYEQLSAARRARLHRAAGEVLEQLHATRLDEYADQLAHHFVAAGDDARSLDHQLRAARAAWRVYAPETAAGHYSSALETAERVGAAPAADVRLRQALLDRGWMHQVMADYEAALADYGRALVAARAAGDRRMEAETLDSLGFVEKSFDVERSGLHHHEALAIAAEIGDVALQVRILSRMALTRATDLDLVGAADAGERARALAEETGEDRDRALAIDAQKLTALQTGDLERLDALTTELEVIERRRGDLWYLQWTLLEGAFVPLAQAQWELADARLQEALTINRRVGDAIATPVIHDAVCWLERSRGDLGRALAEGRLAVEAVERARPAQWGAWTRATLGWALLDARAVSDAIAVLEHGLAVAVTQSDRLRTAGHLAWAHALAGDDIRARDVATEADDALARLRVREGDAFVFGFGAVAGLARAHVVLGDPQRGEAVLAPLLDAASRSGWYEAIASASLVAGLCRAAYSDDEGARSLLGTAVALAGEHGLPGVGWEARAALARLSAPAEAAELRAGSAKLVQGLAAGLRDEALAAALLAAAQS